jgi:hypothetical protein
MTRAPSAASFPRGSYHAILVTKTLEIYGEPGTICREAYLGVPVTDRISDAVHADIDFVNVQVIVIQLP